MTSADSWNLQEDSNRKYLLFNHNKNSIHSKKLKTASRVI